MNELKLMNYRETIVTAVTDYDTVIIKSSTGTGKTTLVPQFLYDAGHRVLVVEPRMLEAYSGYRRILKDRNLTEDSKEIGCKTRNMYRNIQESGILFCVGGFSVIQNISEKDMENLVLIIDEVHEWKLPQEILMGWVNNYRSQGHRIKLVLMSATVDVKVLEDFYSKNSSVKVIEIESEQYPVERFIYHHLHSMGRLHEMAAKKAVEEDKSSLVFCTGKGEIEDAIFLIKEYVKMFNFNNGTNDKEVDVVPLHGSLTFDEQQKVFEESNTPKIIVCTNIAQSGVTPPIQCVFDNGIEKRIEVINGVDTLVERRISKADCDQRAGRAGRFGPGEYYLAGPDDFRPDFPVPEIQRLNLDKTIMKLISMGIDPLEMKFVNQPSKESIQRSLDTMTDLGAMKDGKLTEDGKKMCDMPVGIQSARILLEASKLGCMDEAIKAVVIIETGSLLNPRLCKDKFIDYLSFTTKCYDSDVLAEIDIYDQIMKKKFKSLKEHGIDRKTFYLVKSGIRSLRNSLKNQGYGVYSRAKSDKDIVRCLFKGLEMNFMEFHLYDYCLDSKNEVWDLTGNSKISSSHSYVVGVKKTIHKPGYNKNILHSCTAISKEMITVYGDLDKIRINFIFTDFDPEESIHCVKETSYRDIQIMYTSRIVKKDDEDYLKIYEMFKHEIEEIKEKRRRLDAINRHFILANEYGSSNNDTGNTELKKKLEEAGFNV